jgi:hypothetical protein
LYARKPKDQPSGGEVVVNQEDRVAIVRLWVAAFEDQRTGSRERAAHIPVSAEIR